MVRKRGLSRAVIASCRPHPDWSGFRRESRLWGYLSIPPNAGWQLRGPLAIWLGSSRAKMVHVVSSSRKQEASPQYSVRILSDACSEPQPMSIAIGLKRSCRQCSSAIPRTDPRTRAGEPHATPASDSQGRRSHSDRQPQTSDLQILKRRLPKPHEAERAGRK
jgi:hypothetical protein